MIKFNKRTGTLVGAVIISTLVVAALHFNKGGASSEPPIVQEVKHQGQVLNNHEDRITNTEKDVTDLQNKTQTPPSSTRTVVREVTIPSATEPLTIPTQTPNPTPSPAPSPVIVTAYNRIPVQGSENTDCRFTYSDGTTLQWLWETVTYNQGTKITNRGGVCDNSVIGSIKN